MANLSNINNKFLVTTGGNVLIGQTAAVGSSILQVTGNATFAGNVTTPQINLNSAGGGIIDNQTGNIFIQTPSGTGWIFRNGPSGYDEKMRINSNGNVNLLNATATNSKHYGITNAAGTTGWTFGNGVIANSHQFVIYDNTAGSARMLINSSGNVGIGTSSPDRSLDVRGDGMSIYGTGGYSELMLRGQVEGTGTVRNVGAWHWSVRADVGGNNDDLKLLRFNTGSYAGTAMVVRSDNGGIAIGQNNSGYSSQILSVNSATSDNVFYGESSDANCFASFRDNSSTANIEYGAIGNAHVFRKDASEYMRIDGNGNVGIGDTSPQGKLEVSQNMSNGAASAFTSPHLRLSALNTTDSTGFVGMTFATSTADNYGFSWGALRTVSALGGMHLRYHGNSASGTDIFNIDYVGNVTIPSTRFIRSDSSAGYLIIQGGATYPGGRIEMYGGSNAAAGIIFSTGTTTTSPAERMRIDSSGVVKISNTGDAILTITSGTTNTAKINFGDSSNDDAGIIAYTNDAGGSDTMAFTVGTSEKMRIINSGNIGIGTTSPSEKLDVAGIIRSKGNNNYENILTKEGSTGSFTFTQTELNAGIIDNVSYFIFVSVYRPTTDIANDVGTLLLHGIMPRGGNSIFNTINTLKGPGISVLTATNSGNSLVITTDSGTTFRCAIKLISIGGTS